MHKFSHCTNAYVLDILWGQPIKLAPVDSTSELTASKIKYEKFEPKIFIPR